METSLVSIYMHLFNSSLLFQVGFILIIRLSCLATHWIKISYRYAKPCCVPDDPIHMATSSSLLAIFSPYPALFSGFWKTSLFKLCLDSSESGLCSRNQIGPKTSMVAEAKMLKSIHGDISSKGHTSVPSDFHWILPFGHQSDELSLYINGIVTYHFQLFYI